MATTSRPEIDLVPPILDHLDARSRSVLPAYLREERVAVGTELLTQGQHNERLWFVAAGAVAIERSGANGGHAEVLATLPAPSVFGTTTFYRPEIAASATIRAVDDLRLWTLDRPDQQRLRRDDPVAAEALAEAIIRILSERFDVLDRRLAGLMAEHDRARPRRISSELAAFRTRVFEEPGL